MNRPTSSQVAWGLGRWGLVDVSLLKFSARSIHSSLYLLSLREWKVNLVPSASKPWWSMYIRHGYWLLIMYFLWYSSLINDCSPTSFGSGVSHFTATCMSRVQLGPWHSPSLAGALGQTVLSNLLVKFWVYKRRFLQVAKVFAVRLPIVQVTPIEFMK